VPARRFGDAGLGLTCFGGAFVLARMLFGHLPDGIGAIPVALVSMAVEVVGQFCCGPHPAPPWRSRAHF
jgi:hypothetical protein